MAAAAVAAAAAAGTSASVVDDDQQKRCVGCNVSRPSDGKLLHCLHIICLACLNDSVSERGRIKCALCGVSTNSQRHAHISQQLADCRPLLYADDNSPPAGDVAPQTADTSCQLCADADVVKKATHMCEDCCVCELMCERHAKSHPKRSSSLGHRVVPTIEPSVCTVTSVDEPVPVMKASHSWCPVHTNHRPVKYCNKCQHSVCERCLATGDHREHNVQTIALAATTLRTNLKALCVSSEKASIAPKISAMSAEVDKVKQSAKLTSECVMKTIKKIREVADKMESHLLADIDRKCWSILEPLEMQCRRLNALLLTEVTGTELVKYLLSERSGDEEVVELASMVTASLERLSSDVDESQSAAPTGIRIEAVAKADLDSVMPSLVCVVVSRVELSASKFTIPHHMNVNCIHKITFRALTSDGRPVEVCDALPSLLCTVVSPSGKRTKAKVRHVHDTSKENAEVEIHPSESGRHCLELRYCTQMREMEFQCPRFPNSGLFGEEFRGTFSSSP